ncbi:hypothetical protein HDU92_006868 [Lobulomyces angularis]|nr:hypothetical protein HDU92_006868 [Lobulomyces angularis]
MKTSLYFKSKILFLSIVAAQNYPDANATADITLLCESMPFMAGCSVMTACSGKSDAFCKPFSILSDICAADMPRMNDCTNYRVRCNITGTGDKNVPANPIALLGNTNDAQCKSELPLPSLPSSKSLSSQVSSICSEMNMSGCEKCKNTGSTYMDCNLLEVYSFLCKSMPDMKQCGEWKSLCAATPTLSFCPSSSGSEESEGPPAMKMFFHSGFADYVLFEKWVPRNALQYWLSNLALFVLAIFYEGLSTYLILLEAKWSKFNKAAACYPYRLSTAAGFPSSSSSTFPHSGIRIALTRFLFKFVLTTLGYALMLVTMTFNIAMYFSVVLGFAFGTLIFGGLSKRTRMESTSDPAEEKISACC